MVRRLNPTTQPNQGIVMIRPIVPSYPRAPSETMSRLLTDGFLAPLCHLGEQKVANCYLDVHLRLDDQISVYCGLTSILNAQLETENSIRFSAHDTYKEQKCSKDLFRSWSVDDAHLEEPLRYYLENVEVNNIHTDNEGKIQEEWSRIGKHENRPWIPFDREAVLKYGETNKQVFTQVESARAILTNIAGFRPSRYGKQWREPKESGGNELDQLAIDDKGNLVIIEIKDASAKPEQVFYAPLQLLQYIHEWHNALRWLSVWRDLQKLIDARVRLGLTSGINGVSLTGGIRAAICFGEDSRSDEVKRRFYEALGVANAHLPPNVSPVETWSYSSKSGPRSL